VVGDRSGRGAKLIESLPHVQAFVEQHLPPRPARVLEIGCGCGDLARALADEGFAVTAIDPHAPDGDVFQAVSLEDFANPEPFDAVIAIRSLHHIHDLEGAVEKMAQLLRPGGRIVIHEHAWERLDHDTARWYLDQRTAHGHDHGAPATAEDCIRQWNQDHCDLHTSAAMLAALESHFTQLYFAWAPYLHAELAPVVAAEQEQSLIDAGTIQATGFKFVGEPHP
jgi:SAM-dependent methyltransferase